MIRFGLGRVSHGLVVILGVTIVVFVATHLISDPVRALLPFEATDAQRVALRHQLGLDRPLTVQLVDYIMHVARLDFGQSLWQRRPAIDIVMERLPYTLELVSIAMALAGLSGVVLGTASAVLPGTLLDRSSILLSLIGQSVPQFWLGLMLMILFSVRLGWLPTSGTGDPSHLVLPVITLGLPAMGRVALIVRSSMIDELNKPYIRMAVAKGLSATRVIGVHALRNVSVPAVTMTAWEVVKALAGYTVVVEVVFGWPGLGHLAMDAIYREDIVLLSAVVFVTAVMVVIVNLSVDILYSLLDPRIRLES